jgi:nucleotide-binding universal stress UspA family protein
MTESTPEPTAGPIVVGVDGSENAVRALQVAVTLAEGLDAEILAVHALGLLTTIDGERHPSLDYRDEIEERLQSHWCATLETHRPGRWRSRLIDGSPAEVLLAAAEEAQAGYVVVGARGVGGHPDLMLGSTSHQVIHHSRCPVVVVPPIDRSEASAAQDEARRRL